MFSSNILGTTAAPTSDSVQWPQDNSQYGGIAANYTRPASIRITFVKFFLHIHRQ